MKTKFTLFVSVLAPILFGMGCASVKVTEEQLLGGLVAHYPFDGNAKDASGNGNDCKVVGVAFGVDRYGNPNRSVEYKGSQGIIRMQGGLRLDGSRTVSVWVKMSNFGFIGEDKYSRRIVCNRSNNSDPFSLTTADSSRPGFAFTVGPSDTAPAPALQQICAQYISNNKHEKEIIGKWVQVVGVFSLSPSKVYVYVNGVDRGVARSSRSLGFHTSKSHVLAIGNYPEPSYGIEGSIDDVRIYNRALSAEEVKALYDLEKPKGK